MNRKIAIMGCGWLGLPLAKRFLAEGHFVQGSTTSEGKIQYLKDEGIVPFQISLSEDMVSGDIGSFLRDMEILVINVPPRLRSGLKENYVKKMELLYKAIGESGIKKVVFVSSTSVYGDIEGEVTEETKPRPVTESGKQLLASEDMFRNDGTLKTTIIRFGGLIDGERHPVKMLAGKKNVSNGNHAINLIHRNDCIDIIDQIIKEGWWNEIFNAVYPYHPPKKEYYAQEAKKRGLEHPHYSADNQSIGKIICSNRLILVKNYHFTTTL